MVLSAPAAHDEVPAPDAASWVEPIRLSLGLSKTRGILIHVDQAVPQRLGDLVRGLIGDFPDLDVHADLRAIDDAPEGSVMVLVLRPEHAGPLNMGRPIFAHKRLRVVLFCDHETTIALSQEAPDFFDWISEHHDCPPGPVPHAVAGLRAAEAAGAPGIVWRGACGKAGLWAAFDAAFPGVAFPKVIGTEYSKIVEVVRDSKQSWMVCTAQANAHVRRLRWAMAEARRRGRVILVTPDLPSPGWWPVHDHLAPFVEARARFEEALSKRPGVLAGLVGLDPDAIDLAITAMGLGVSEEALKANLAKAMDPGAALAKVAYAKGALDIDKIAFGLASSATLRGLAAHPDVERRRSEKMVATRVAILRGEHVDANDIGYWAAVVRSPPRISRKVALQATLEMRTFVVELLLHGRTFGVDGTTSEIAMDLGEDWVAAGWARDFVQSGGAHDPHLRQVVRRLSAAQHWSAPLLEQSIRAHLTRARSEMRTGLVFVCAFVAWLAYTTFQETGNDRWVFLSMSIGFSMIFAILVRRLLVRERGDRPNMLEVRLRDAESQLRKGAFELAAQALEALAIDTRIALGEEHPLHRRALALFGHVRLVQGENAQALDALTRACVVEVRVDGLQSTALTPILSDLASLSTSLGSAAGARALLSKMLEAGGGTSSFERSDPIIESIVPNGSPELNDVVHQFLVLSSRLSLSAEQRARALRLLAETMMSESRYRDAEDMLQDATKQFEPNLSHDHPERALTLATHGRVLFLDRRPREAEPILRRALALAERHAGPTHPDTARILALLARVEQALGDASAPKTARRALDLFAMAQVSEAEKTLVRGELTPFAAGAPSD